MRPDTGARRTNVTTRASAVMATALAALACACTVRADDLRGVITATLAGNPELAAQRSKLAAVREEEKRARAAWRPVISATAEVGPSRQANFYDQSLFDAEKTQTLEDFRVKLVQPIYRGGRTVYGTRAARAAIAAEQARTAALEETVALAAARSYLDVYRDISIVGLRSDSELNLREQLRLTEAAFTAEAVTATDVTQARARWFGASVLKRRAAGELNRSEEEFRRVVGQPARELADPSRTIEAIAGTLDTGHCNLDGNSELSAARHDELSQYYRVREIRGKALPSVDFELSANRISGNALSSQFIVAPLRSEGVSAVLRFTIPIYQAGQVSAELRAARQAALAARSNIESVRDSVTSQLNSNLATWRSLKDERELLERQVSELRSALEGVRNEQQLGARTILEVLNAQEELTSARIALLESTHDVALSVLQVTSLSGCLRTEMFPDRNAD